ncbi:MAG TPA: hypothetical protein VGO53_16320 [Steroidobacteraceae bacterium]|nr:hypothetical protein [Steroidobacteraceae bacterium]
MIEELKPMHARPLTRGTWLISIGESRVLCLAFRRRRYYVTIWPPKLWHRRWRAP